jgi:D-arginine dehydrogenase
VTYDIAIVGAGIVGATIAAELVGQASVLLLEAEDQPGYHSTGRSAAFWSETYGGPGIQPLTTASTKAFQEGGWLEPLGSLHIGRAEDAGAMEAFLAAFADTPVILETVNPAAHVPGLRPEWVLGVLEPTCAYIDVGGLHGAALGKAKRGGAVLVNGARLTGAERRDGVWHLDTSAGPYQARILVDAAGAWADPIARLAGAKPIGIQAYQRTVVQLRTDPPPPEGLAHIVDIAKTFYFKPEAGGRLWLSPQDETPVDPHDCAPEELDVAIAIDRFEHCVDWRVTAVERRWAGLRSFAPDRLPVYGFDADVPGFFWAAGQGGFGIQTAPAAAELAAALLLGTGAMPAGVDPDRYRPDRFLT